MLLPHVEINYDRPNHVAEPPHQGGNFIANNQTITFAAIGSNAYDHHTSSNHDSLSVEQVLILDHVAMLLSILKTTSSRGVDPQDDNGMITVDDRNIIARINGLLELL